MNIYLRTISIINSKLLPIFPYGPLAAEIILESESIFFIFSSNSYFVSIFNFFTFDYFHCSKELDVFFPPENL